MSNERCKRANRTTTKGTQKNERKRCDVTLRQAPVARTASVPGCPWVSSHVALVYLHNGKQLNTQSLVLRRATIVSPCHRNRKVISEGSVWQTLCRWLPFPCLPACLPRRIKIGFILHMFRISSWECLGYLSTPLHWRQRGRDKTGGGRKSNDSSLGQAGRTFAPFA